LREYPRLLRHRLRRWRRRLARTPTLGWSSLASESPAMDNFKAAFSVDDSNIKVALRESEHDTEAATTCGGSFSSRMQSQPSHYERNATLPDCKETAANTSFSAKKKAALLAVFVLIRAVHPLVVSQTKVGGKYVYEPLTVPLIESLVSWFAAQGLAMANGGGKLWSTIWDPRPMAVFSMIGVCYGFSDYLEMKSLGSLSGPVYQVLSQGKIVVTAALLYAVKGQKQSALQWILLMALTLSSCVYSIMNDILEQHRLLEKGGSNVAMAEAASNSTFGMLMVVLKVTVSCLCSVLSDKHMKAFKSEPIYVQIAQFKVAWTATLLILATLEGGFQDGPAAFFHDWRPITCAAVVSYAAKGWSGMYLLALLDSMTKGIGDAMSVLLAYFIVVFHGSFDDEYETETFIAVMVVLLCIAAYLASKDVVSKAASFEEAERKSTDKARAVVVV